VSADGRDDVDGRPVSDPPGEISPGGSDNSAEEGTEEVEVAARAALSRARAAARSKGLRPGQSGQTAAQLARRRAKLAGQGRFSAAGADARDPELFGQTVDRIVGERGWTTEVAVGGVMGRWAQIVGAEISAHVAPESFEDGVLTVRADSTAWSTQVRLLAPTLLRRLAEELGEGVVERVAVGGPMGPSWRKGLRRVPGRGPRDTYG
jgi:predicted nucleic acid-binding Zn ribbon protein